MIIPLMGISQDDQFFITNEVTKPRNPRVWECDGYLNIQDSIATFIVRYRGETRGIQGKVSNYVTEETQDFYIQKFYVVGTGLTIGQVISFEIKESTSTDEVIIIVYKKLSQYNLIFKSELIKWI